jgi:hypothetical protein
MATPGGRPPRSIPAVDLVAEGLCYPLCLVAGDRDINGRCRCRCRGEFHGALADAPVEIGSQVSSWWRACGHGGWDLGVCPVVRSKRDDFRLWKDFKATGSPVCWVEAYLPREMGFRVLWDGVTMRLRTRELVALWSEREARLLNRMIYRLMMQRRARQGFCAPGEHLSVTSIREFDEARTIALIISDCFAGNPCSAVRAIEVLEGRPDPISLGLDPEHGYPDSLAYKDNPAADWSGALLARD